MIRRGLSWAWLGLAACAVVLAVLVTLLRFGSPWLAAWQQQWLDRLLSEQQLTLEVGQLGLSWQDYGPLLVVDEVSLHRSEGPAITLRRALVDLHLWQSLRRWRPVLNELTLEGLRLPLDLTAGEAADRHTDLAFLRRLALEGVERFSLHDALLVVTAPEQDLLELHVPALHWHNQPGRHQGQGRLGFGPDGSQQFTLKGHFEGPADRLDGGLYLQADRVDAASTIARIRPDDDHIGADLSFELWLDWRQGLLDAGLLQLGENRLRWGDDHQIAVDGGRIQWQPTQAGWQLASSGIDISVDGEAWPSWRIQLDRQDDRMHGYLDRLTFADLALLAQWGESFWPGAARQLAGIAPGGELSGLYFSARPDGADWLVRGELNDVSTHPFQWVPGTRGLQGDFLLTPTRGRLSLRQQEAADWVYESAFRAPWPMQRLDTELNWRRQPQGWLLWSDRVQLETRDLALQGWFSLQLPQRGSPLLSASAEVDLARAEQAFTYFPEPLMGSPLVDYLQGAILAGKAEQAEVLWYGRLDGFPYADGSGLFQARVPLREAEFRFDPGWRPLTDLSLDLLFENDGLYMTGTSGKLGEVDAADIDARIAPLNKAASLQLSAGISGEGKAVTRYLQQSPLAGSVGKTLQQVQVAGPLEGRLALDIPLNGGEVGVEGQVDFVRNRVQISSLGLPLSEVSGRLLFDERQTHFEALQAEWAGQPLELDYRGQVTEQGYEVRLDMRGRILAPVLARQYPPLQALNGEAAWQGRLWLTLAEQGEFSYRFEADTELRGMASRLPAPLHKTAEQPRPARLMLNGNDRQAEIALSLEPDIQGQAELRFESGGTRVSRLWLSAGEAGPAAARAPFDIALRLPELPLDDWLALLGADWQQGEATAAPQLRWPEPFRVVIQATEARLWRQPFNQLRLQLEPDGEERLRLAFRAEQAEGELAWGGTTPARAELRRLWLSPAPGDDRLAQHAADISPRLVPALEVECQDCRWRELALGRLSFRLEPQPEQNGVRLVDLRLDGPLLQGTAEGQWLQHQSGNLSRLEWQARTPSLQRLWQGLGQESPFSETQASLTGQLRWLDLPWRPDRASMSGSLGAETGAGVLTELNDRGAGLLSVLSMESVLRRLRLDFRDVFEQGFYFDRIGASGELRNGVLHNDDFVLNGAAGDLRGRGQLDLVAEQLDYQFDFTPNLTGNLPVLAAFAVTPVTGLYVLALSKVLGPVVDVFTRIRYRVSGPLAQPQVTELVREQERVNLPRNNKE
ncbi:YhdP family protein [Zobellella sp. DQSA1]|uniref:YhdP family protein n=1 Tax=Zobellella sp. DQSA1 TaxID=3342386 RepID=UPI0035C1AFD8